MTSDPRCHRCDAALAGVARQDLVAGTRLSAPSDGRLCPHCGWASIQDDGSDRSTVDLASALRGRADVAGLLDDCDDRATLRHHLSLLRAVLGGSIRDEVLTQPDVTRVVLVSMLTSLSGELSVLDDRTVLSAQQLYGCLLSLGPVRLREPLPPLDAAAEQWAQRLLDAVATHSMVCSVVSELDAGLVDSARLHDGVVELTTTPLGRWALEVNLNAVRDGAPVDRDMLAQVDAVERSVFGSSITDLVTLVAEPEALTSVTRVEDSDGLLVVDLAGPHPAVRALHRRLVLTDDTWRGHALPSFFLADDRPDSGSPSGTLIKAATVDWLRYLPLLAGDYGPPAERRPLAFTTRTLLDRAYARASGSAAGRVERAARAAAGTPSAATTNAAARAVHAAFEAETADACRAAGGTAAHSIDTVGRRALPCGEIDALSLLDGAAGPVLLVIECKNVDVTFYKAYGVHQARDTLGRASAQALRKAAWVAGHWPATAAHLGWPAAPPVVVAAVVTRAVDVPREPDGVVVVRLHSLPALIESMRARPRESWRADLRASVVPA